MGGGRGALRGEERASFDVAESEQLVVDFERLLKSDMGKGPLVMPDTIREHVRNATPPKERKERREREDFAEAEALAAGRG